LRDASQSQVNNVLFIFIKFCLALSKNIGQNLFYSCDVYEKYSFCMFVYLVISFIFLIFSFVFIGASFSMAIMHTLLFSCFCQNLSKYLTVINLLFHVHEASLDHRKCAHLSSYVSLSLCVLCVHQGCSFIHSFIKPLDRRWVVVPSILLDHWLCPMRHQRRVLFRLPVVASTDGEAGHVDVSTAACCRGGDQFLP